MSSQQSGSAAEEILRGKDLPAIFRLWEENQSQPGYDAVPLLKRLSEIFEEETGAYMRKDPDPFDERHPSRTDPECELGRSLKLLFRKDFFMTKLINDYLRDNYFTRQNIQKSSLELNIAACRLILIIMPGLETSAVFQSEYDNLINRIYNWAEDSIEPLQSYATGLLAAAMETTEIAISFREQNTRLVPKMLKRLHMLQAIHKSREKESDETQLNGESSKNEKNEEGVSFQRIFPTWMGGSEPSSPAKIEEATTQNGLTKFPSTSNLSTLLENENSVDTSQQKFTKKFLIPIHPPTTATSQMLILRYLTSMGEYQEFLGQVFEHGAMNIIFGYIENLDPRDTCLAFEALKYLASLLCHKKFALEFVSRGGLELLLKVPRPSIASTGVSITFYYLAYCEDAMERICSMPKKIVSELVKYALWLLGRSHDSGKCHATMFFGLSFQFKMILDEFDAQDGLRKLYNVISILPILSAEDNITLNDDEECAARQLVKHVCIALKKYMESHLFFKYNHFMRQQCPSNETYQPVSKATKAALEQISDQIRTLQENMPMRSYWTPVGQLLQLGGISLLLRIIAYSYEWNNNGRAETVRSALDVLSICCVIPKVYVAFCDRMKLPDSSSSAGINAILGAAFGEIIADAEVQKSALAVLVHCVCAPTTRSLKISPGSAKKKLAKYPEELVEKVWESVCSNNGIIVLLQLMQIKTPITDADCIRGMACRALAGLARSERVRQIIGKLPLFANGQIQHLMRDPILQEKRAEHVLFQKYALELFERVSGKTKPVSNQLDASLANIHKANVVAQTRIQYNEQQLMQLIHDHLVSKGMTQSASMLQKEAGLNTPIPTKSFHYSPLDFKVLPSSSISRSRLRTRLQELNSNLPPNKNENNIQQNNNTNQNCNSNNQCTSMNNSLINGQLDSISTDEHLQSLTPIKLIKRSSSSTNVLNTSSTLLQPLTPAAPNATHSRSLQKQISSHAAEPSFPINLPSIQRSHSESSNITNTVTLNTIVTEYLTNQHALCNNPMTTCPQFDLFIPHKCPDPKPNRALGLDNNLTARWFKTQIGYNTMKLDRRFVHMQFCPWRTIRPQDYNELQFTCCDFLPTNNQIVVGTFIGEAKVYNINESNEEFSAQCHESFLDNIKCNREGNLVLTSSSWRAPLSVLWSITNKEFENKLQFDDDLYCEFSNLTQDKILGTKMDAATLYDINTGQVISTFKPTISNQYTKNRATLCPTDELILSDGVLWDVKSGKEIHKFDKLNQTLSGVFHPNGLEIVSNTEVWDLRTFHLLQTVPVLDQCFIKFSPLNVIYGISLDSDTRTDFEVTNSYDTSFKVLDSFDYSSISTIDVKRNIFDLSINTSGSHIALVENQVAYDSLQESFIRVYSVGIRKNDEQEEEEDEEMESEENSGSDSGDSNPLMTFADEIRMRRRNRNRRRRNNAENDNSSNSSNDEWEDIPFLSSSSDNNDNDEGENNDEDNGSESSITSFSDNGGGSGSDEMEIEFQWNF